MSLIELKQNTFQVLLKKSIGMKKKRSIEGEILSIFLSIRSKYRNIHAFCSQSIVSRLTTWYHFQTYKTKYCVVLIMRLYIFFSVEKKTLEAMQFLRKNREQNVQLSSQSTIAIRSIGIALFPLHTHSVHVSRTAFIGIVNTFTGKRETPSASIRVSIVKSFRQHRTKQTEVFDKPCSKCQRKKVEKKMTIKNIWIKQFVSPFFWFFLIK